MNFHLDSSVTNILLYLPFPLSFASINLDPVILILVNLLRESCRDHDSLPLNTSSHIT